MTILGSKKESEPEVIPPKMGEYFKFYYCKDCGHAVHDRAIKSVECCAKCGHEPMVKTVGRWRYEWKVNPYFSSYKAVKFFPKGSEETAKV